MAIASQNAIAKIIAVWIRPEASGFLPIAVIALDANNPIEIAGAADPIAIVRAT
jgi:hypothetical protein